MQEEEKDSVIHSQFTNLPSKILQNHRDFVEKKDIHGQCYYKSFEATCVHDNLRYIIRVLDTGSDFVNANRENIITLFLQEILYLCVKIEDREALKIEDFTFSDRHIAFVLPHATSSLKDVYTHSKSEIKDVEKVLANIISELEFMKRKLKLTFPNIVSEKIFSLNGELFLADWAAGQPLQLKKKLRLDEKGSNKTSRGDIEELSSTAFDDTTQISALSLIGLQIETSKMTRFDRSLLEGWTCTGEGEIAQVFKKMNLVLNELKSVQTESDLEKVKKNSDFKMNSKEEEVFKTIYKNLNSDSLLIAFLSDKNNTINIYNSKTREIFSSQGPQITNSIYKNYVLQSVPGSNLLIASASTFQHNKASFNVLDASDLANIKKVFSLPTTDGQIYDIACHSKSNRVALLSNPGKTLYHLYDSTNWTLQAKRVPPSEFKYNVVASLDFSPSGDLIALASDDYCKFAVGNVNDGQILFQKVYPDKSSPHGVNCLEKRINLCRWNPIDPVIATVIHHDIHSEMTNRNNRMKELYLIDAVTQKSVKINGVDIPHEGRIPSIDWHEDGNLLALCVSINHSKYTPSAYHMSTLSYHHEGFVLIYDKRAGTVCKYFSDVLSLGPSSHEITDLLRGAKWTPQGDALTVARKLHNFDYAIMMLDLNSDSFRGGFKSPMENLGANSICFLNS